MKVCEKGVNNNLIYKLLSFVDHVDEGLSHRTDHVDQQI